MIDEYKEGDTIQLLIAGTHIGAVMEDWLESHRACDIRVRRAKTKGCVVLETTDVIYAAHIVQWFPKVKTNISRCSKLF